ncbi:MAG: hypothetical protein ACD_62C00344G0001 [uncultured bacterium]|nr:MAG: hypothetical protein ACD_62C00344G0001 [uncultured bacterium]
MMGHKSINHQPESHQPHLGQTVYMLQGDVAQKRDTNPSE